MSEKEWEEDFSQYVGILVKQTRPNRVGPRSVPLLRLGGKTKGHNRATVLLRVSVGDNFNLPVKGRSLREQRQKDGILDRLQYQCMLLSYN